MEKKGKTFIYVWGNKGQYDKHCSTSKPFSQGGCSLGIICIKEPLIKDDSFNVIELNLIWNLSSDLGKPKCEVGSTLDMGDSHSQICC